MLQIYLIIFLESTPPPPGGAPPGFPIPFIYGFLVFSIVFGIIRKYKKRLF